MPRIDRVIESKARDSSPSSSSLATPALASRSPAWICPAAIVRRRSPEPMRSPTTAARTTATSPATSATTNSSLNRSSRVPATKVAGTETTTDATGLTSGTMGCATSNRPPRLASVVADTSIARRLTSSTEASDGWSPVRASTASRVAIVKP